MGVSSTSYLNSVKPSYCTMEQYNKLFREVEYFKGLLSCMKKQIDSLSETVINNNIDKPPIYIPWDDIAGNKYLNNELYDTIYVVLLNGVKVLLEGIDYTDLTDSDDVGGFEIINPALVDQENDYVVFR